MEISMADVQELALENFLLRRDLDRLRAANQELQHLLAENARPESGTGDAAPAN